MKAETRIALAKLVGELEDTDPSTWGPLGGVRDQVEALRKQKNDLSVTLAKTRWVLQRAIALLVEDESA